MARVVVGRRDEWRVVRAGGEPIQRRWMSDWRLGVGQLSVFAKRKGGLRSYFRADSKGWRIASFFAAAVLSVSTSLSDSVLLKTHVLAIDHCHTTDRLAT